jgi:hypothetical protein
LARQPAHHGHKRKSNRSFHQDGPNTPSCRRARRPRQVADDES